MMGEKIHTSRIIPSHGQLLVLGSCPCFWVSVQCEAIDRLLFLDDTLLCFLCFCLILAFQNPSNFRNIYSIIFRACSFKLFIIGFFDFAAVANLYEFSLDFTSNVLNLAKNVYIFNMLQPIVHLKIGFPPKSSNSIEISRPRWVKHVKYSRSLCPKKHCQKWTFAFTSSRGSIWSSR